VAEMKLNQYGGPSAIETLPARQYTEGAGLRRREETLVSETMLAAASAHLLGI